MVFLVKRLVLLLQKFELVLQFVQGVGPLALLTFQLFSHFGDLDFGRQAGKSTTVVDIQVNT